MKKNEGTERISEHTESKYSEISRDVWILFKKYLLIDADLSTFTDDVHALDQKYAKKEGYQFMQKLLKVYFDELKEIKE